MANTAEGLTVGGEEGLDPNDPAAFEKIMAGRGVQVEEGEERSPDRSIASGLTVAGPEQALARDAETGKFVSNQEKEPTAQIVEKTATETSGEVQTGDFANDPEVQAVLAKYDGDVNKALKGLADAQSLIGRRDERTDALENELAETRGKLEGFIAAGARANAPQALSNDQVLEIATSRVETLGYEDAATEAANVAHTTGDERALSAVLEQWQMESPFAAMNFLTDFRLWQKDQREAANTVEEETPAWALRAEEAAAVESLTGVIQSIADERGVPKDSPIIEQMLPALENMPKNILEMVGSSDPESVADGVRLVMDRATILAGQKVATVEPVVEGGASASVARKLAGAAVASGALRPAEQAKAAPTDRETVIAQFKRDIVEAPTTNISSGLTYGPTP